MPFRYSCPVEVRFRDCDPMGHVNNAVYLSYLEVGRFAYWRDVCGDSITRDVSFIMARAEIDYKAAAGQGDLLDVRIGITGFGRSSFVFEYEIVDHDGRIVATAKTVQVMYDYTAGRSIPVPQSFKDKVAAYEGLSL